MRRPAPDRDIAVPGVGLSLSSSALLLAFVVAACGNGGSAGGAHPAASGGASASGGQSGSGGETGTGGQGVDGGVAQGGRQGSGASTGTGGSPSAASGGAPGTGGRALPGGGGGATSSGGIGSGGTAASGGARAGGGSGTAGVIGSGGGKPGGSPASGGSSADGGTSDSGTSDADPCGESNPGRVTLPTFGTQAFDVTSYGTKGDGVADDTKALQAALTAAAEAGGGLVAMPKGTYLSGPLTVGSGTRLDLAAGATLKMLPRSSYPGVTPLLNASGAHDIGLTGSGTIDGQGQDWWTAFAADSTVERPQLMVWNNSSRVLISGVRLQNPPEEHIWVKSDTDVTITGITISTLAVSGQSPPKNTDGIDITATGAFLCGNAIAAGDDNIALNGKNIYIGHSKLGVGHGCSIGSITKNGVSKLVVEYLDFDGTTSGIRMKSGRDRGGLVQGLTYSNITMKNVQNPVYITSFYPDLPKDPTADAVQAVTATTPYWKDITIKDLTATGSTNGGILWGLPEAKISGVTFDNVRIQSTTGMVIYHAEGVSFVGGSSVTPKSGDAVKVYDASVSGVPTTPY